MKIIMDSGAYSAFTQKKEIKVMDYVAFIRKNKKYFEAYINLDVIGNAEASWENQKIMEAEGLAPMPVFHYGEDWSYLERCLQYDYFGLGGIANAGSNVRIPFLSECFERTCDDKGMPRSKVHGLGMTSFTLMRKFPFYSVDSSSWLMTGAMGSILIPRKRKGVYYYNEDPLRVAISSSNPATAREMHYDSLNIEAKTAVDDYLKLKGYVLGPRDVKANHPDAGIYSSPYLREQLNMECFLDFRDSLPEWPWAYERKTKRRLW